MWQLCDNFNGLYPRNEMRYRQSIKCVDNYKGSHTSSQNVVNFGPQTACNLTATLPTLFKFCFLRHCQTTHMEISKQNSTTLCQTAAVERLELSREEKKWGPRNVYICSVFRRLRHLMANIFWTKGNVDNRQERWKVRRVSHRKNGAKKLLHLFRFSTTSTLNSKYLLNETWNRRSGEGAG